MSDIRANTISDAAGTGPIDLYKQSAAKAHCTFNGTGTISVSGVSFNISSLSDNGTGLYRTNFINNMADGEHVDAFACRENSSSNGGDINKFVSYNRVNQSPSYTDLTSQNNFVTPQDVARICVVTHGDLA